MAGELQAQFTTGATLYCVLLNATGGVWNGSAFDTTPTSGEWGTYAIAMAEDGGSSCYRGDMPGATAGVYRYRVHKRIAGSAAVSDPVVWTDDGCWSGAAWVYQTGDSYARIGAAGGGLTAVGDTRLANLDAAVSSRSTYAGGDTAGTTTLLSRVTALLQTKAEADTAHSLLATAAALNVVASYVDTEVSAIKAKTDSLPSDPADQSLVEAAIAAAQGALSALIAALNDLSAGEVEDLIAAGAGATPATFWAYGDRTLTMRPRLLYQAQEQDRLAIVRGDGFYQELQALGPIAAGLADIVLTIKLGAEDADEDAILQLSMTDGVLVLMGAEPSLAEGDTSAIVLMDEDSGDISVRLSPAVTSVLRATGAFGSLYVADIQFEYDDGGRYTPVALAVSVTPDITRR